MKKYIIIALLIFSGNIIAQIEFEEHIIIDDTYATKGATSVFSSDINGDGNMDVVTSSREDNKIAWYENLGDGSFAIQNIISLNALGASFVYAIDIDGDNDIDVLSSSWFDDKIAWYENIDGLGTFSDENVISSNAIWATSLHVADLDNDGDLDVLSSSRNDNKIAWYENIDGEGNFIDEIIISNNAELTHSVYAADIDNDGDMDVLSASSGNDSIEWYENTDGEGNFSNAIIISIELDYPLSVYANDIDNDGDMDVISASRNDSKIAWYENFGDGNFGTQQEIISNLLGASGVYVEDLDSDGDNDLLVSWWDSDTIAWYENLDGQGVFGTAQILNSNANLALSVFATDLDNDGNIDVLSASEIDNKVAWYKGLDGEGNFGEQIMISIGADRANFVDAVDLDGDGDLDVLSASGEDDKIAWYENIDGQGDFGIQQVISLNANLAWIVQSADIDGDGDIDVISGAKGNSSIKWHENTDGQGDFSSEHLITNLVYGIDSFFITDLDGDNDLDVLSSSSNDNKIAWYENLDGLGNYGPQQILANYEGSWSVFAADLDGDNDMDVLSASSVDERIVWFKNIDGQANFGSEQIIELNAGFVYDVFVEDIDGDNFNDVVVSFAEDKIVWYKNLDGLGNFENQQIISTDIQRPYSIHVEDIDGDGDMDVLSASKNDNKIVLYENIDGLGNFGSQQILSEEAVNANCVFSADIDGDGDIDVLSASDGDDKITWFENLGILSVSENEFNDLKIYPNPTNGLLNIQSNVLIVSVEVINQLGKLVVSNKNSKGINQISIQQLQQGLYFIKLKDVQGNSMIQKLIKE